MITNPVIIVGINYFDMENYNQEKYKRAKKKVEQIKGFYTHLTVYIIINLIIFVRGNIMVFLKSDVENKNLLDWIDWNIFFTPVLWGIGLFFHGLFVFQNRFKVLKNWEDRKMKEFLEKEEEDLHYNNKWK